MATSDNSGYNPLNYEAPANGGDAAAASWQQGQDAYQTGYNALGSQIQTAKAVPGTFADVAKANEAQRQANLSELNRRSGQILYQGRGSLGGGGGLAALQQANATNNWSLLGFNRDAAAQRANEAQQANEASMNAEGVIANAAGQQYKMNQEQTVGRQKRINDALAQAKAIYHQKAGTFYTSDSDRADAAKAIREQVLAQETDPMVIQAVNGYLNDLGNQSGGSLLDIVTSKTK